MSVQDLLAPNIKCFIILHQRKASSKFQFSCYDGKINVDLKHDLGEVKSSSPPQAYLVNPSYSDIDKKNKSMSQINRLQRKDKARAEESQFSEKVHIEKVKTDSKN